MHPYGGTYHGAGPWSGSSSAPAGNYVEPPEQVCEELLQEGTGAFAILEFGGAEAEHLVSTELEVPVTAHVGCVLGAVRSSVRAGEVMGSVHFEDDSLPIRQEEQEIHAESQQCFTAAVADGLWVPVQPYFGQERREVLHCAAVDLVVELVQILLRRRVFGQATDKPLVERLLGFGVAGELLRVFPPCLQVAPSDAVASDRAIID